MSAVIGDRPPQSIAPAGQITHPSGISSKPRKQQGVYQPRRGQSSLAITGCGGNTLLSIDAKPNHLIDSIAFQTRFIALVQWELLIVS
jgi:hypothetical protein